MIENIKCNCKTYLMKKSIGIRVTPSAIFFSVVSYDNEELEITLIDKIINPKALGLPEQLKFLRNTLFDIINEFAITNACIRITESNAQRNNITRIYIEGVIQELFASSTIVKYYIGQVSNISANLGIQRASFKPLVKGEEIFLEIENWVNYSKEERESIMSAVSALNI